MKRFLRYLFGALMMVCVVLNSASVVAEPKKPKLDDEERFFRVEELIITASKKKQKISEAPSTIHVITRREMELYPGRSLADVLRMVPGVQVRTWLSQYHNVMIRGMLGTEVVNTRILWLIDGASINDVRDGGVWLDESFPLQHIKRIEVISGPGSALYGTNAFQGVVHLITLDPKDIPKYGIYRARFGSFRRSGVDATWGRQFGKWGIVLSAAVGYTDGPGFITEFLKDKGVSPGRNPSSSRLWQHGFFKLQYDKLATLTVNFRNLDAGFDGAVFFPNQRFKFDQMELGVNLVLSHRFNKKIALKGQVAYHLFQDRFSDYNDCRSDSCTDPVLNRPVPLTGERVVVDGLSYILPQDVADKIKYDVNQHKLEAFVQAQWQMFKISHVTNELIGGVGVRFEQISSPEFLPDRRKQSFTNASVYLQNELGVLNNDLLIVLGARFDTHRLYRAQFSFRGSILYKFVKRGTIRVSYGSAFREPAMWHLFIDHIDATGNPDLKPETLHNVELSVAWNPRRWFRFRVDVFYTRMTNIITNDFVPDPANSTEVHLNHGRFIPNQIAGHANFIGVEVEIRSQITRWLEFFANYSYLNARFHPDAGESFRLDYDSQHKVNTGLAARYKRFSGALKVHWVSQTEDKSIGIKRKVPDYTIYQARVQVNLIAGLTLGVQASFIDSLGVQSSDGRDRYQEMLGVPVPRFTFMTELSYPFQ